MSCAPALHHCSLSRSTVDLASSVRYYCHSLEHVFYSRVDMIPGIFRSTELNEGTTDGCN